MLIVERITMVFLIFNCLKYFQLISSQNPWHVKKIHILVSVVVAMCRYEEFYIRIKLGLFLFVSLQFESLLFYIRKIQSLWVFSTVRTLHAKRIDSMMLEYNRGSLLISYPIPIYLLKFGFFIISIIVSIINIFHYFQNFVYDFSIFI